MPTDIKTEPALLRRLRAAAGKRLTKDEIRSQRLSFIRGSISVESHPTTEQIEQVLKRLDQGK